MKLIEKTGYAIVALTIWAAALGLIGYFGWHLIVSKWGLYALIPGMMSLVLFPLGSAAWPFDTLIDEQKEHNENVERMLAVIAMGVHPELMKDEDEDEAN